MDLLVIFFHFFLGDPIVRAIFVLSGLYGTTTAMIFSFSQNRVKLLSNGIRLFFLFC